MSGETNDSPGFPLPEAFAAQDLQQESYEYQERPPRTEFLAWHRARKQYVRERQWTRAVLEVMEKRDAGDRLKYVGLPGVDLLDLRHLLKTVCEPTGRPLQYIGFDVAAGSGDSMAATELNISVSELSERKLVHKPSMVRPDDVRYIGSKTTLAWLAVKDFGHVDVVNLDLTTNLLCGDPNATASHQSAVRELMALQLGNPNPWVLLLTTHIDRPSACAEALIPIERTLLDAIAECPEMLEQFEKRLAEPLSARSLSSCPEDEFGFLMLSGITKWLRDLVSGGTVRKRMKVTSCFRYTSFASGGISDVASLVIKFVPLDVSLDDEAHGIQASPIALDPCGDLSRYVQRVAEAPDIDQRIRADKDLKAKLIESAADLMEEARFSRAAYVRWAEAQAS